MKLRLQDLQNSKELVIENGGAILGREGSHVADIQFPQNTISNKHARIYAKEDAWYLEDLGSLNGTFIGEQRILQPTQLNPGMHFSLTTYRFKVIDIVHDTAKHALEEDTASDVSIVCIEENQAPKFEELVKEALPEKVEIQTPPPVVEEPKKEPEKVEVKPHHSFKEIHEKPEPKREDDGGKIEIPRMSFNEVVNNSVKSCTSFITKNFKPYRWLIVVILFLVGLMGLVISRHSQISRKSTSSQQIEEVAPTINQKAIEQTKIVPTVEPTIAAKQKPSEVLTNGITSTGTEKMAPLVSYGEYKLRRDFIDQSISSDPTLLKSVKGLALNYENFYRIVYTTRLKYKGKRVKPSSAALMAKEKINDYLIETEIYEKTSPVVDKMYFMLNQKITQ